MSAILTDTGSMAEWIKYSAYGVPFALPAGDTDADGDWDAADQTTITSSLGYDLRHDATLDGVVNSADVTHANSIAGGGGGFQTLGRGRLSSTGVGNRRGYAGYEYAPEFEGAGGGGGGGRHLSHARHRVYDAGLGRWTRRDPLGYVDGMSLYEYVTSEPIGHSDPFGLSKKGDKERWWGVPKQLRDAPGFSECFHQHKDRQGYPPNRHLDKKEMWEVVEDYLREQGDRLPKELRERLWHEIRSKPMLFGPIGLLLIVQEAQAAITERGAPCRLLLEALKVASETGSCTPAQIRRLGDECSHDLLERGGKAGGSALGIGVKEQFERLLEQIVEACERSTRKCMPTGDAGAHTQSCHPRALTQ